jgi:hypothetical protein
VSIKRGERLVQIRKAGGAREGYCLHLEESDRGGMDRVVDSEGACVLIVRGGRLFGVAVVAVAVGEVVEQGAADVVQKAVLVGVAAVVAVNVHVSHSADVRPHLSSSSLHSRFLSLSLSLSHTHTKVPL